jgi:hypothetical protein
LKLSREFVCGRLRQNGRRELEGGGQSRNEEEGSISFSYFDDITRQRPKVAAANEEMVAGHFISPA